MFYNAKKREDNIKQAADKQNLALKAQISSLQEELDSVKAQLSQYQRMLFGKKSEKSKATGAVAHIWHVDETGWKVFKKIKDKKTYNWYLWVYCNAKTSVYMLAPGSGLNVPQEFFNGVNDGGIISSDRLENKLQIIQLKCQEQLSNNTLYIDGVKVLRSLQKFWRGLTTFELRPKIPISNMEH